MEYRAHPKADVPSNGTTKTASIYSQVRQGWHTQGLVQAVLSVDWQEALASASLLPPQKQLE